VPASATKASAVAASGSTIIRRIRSAAAAIAGRRAPSGSDGHSAVATSSALGLVASGAGSGVQVSTTPAPSRQVARISVRNTDGPRAFFTPSPHQ
jgi:hypothetical protein